MTSKELKREVLKQKKPGVVVVAVEPDDSPVLSGGKAGPHKIQGIGAGFVPNILNVSVIDEVFRVKNVEAMANVSDKSFLLVFRYMMIIMLFIVLFKPQRWLIESDFDFKTTRWITIPIYLLIGLYGGFIQMGAGIFILAALVLVSRYSMMEANAVKTVVIFIYTLVVMMIFAWKGMIDWKIGFIMSFGQTLGGYLTAAYFSKMPGINLWAYRLLVLIIVLSILVQFEIIEF